MQEFDFLKGIDKRAWSWYNYAAAGSSQYV
jgi:hypothetical protein